MISKTIMRRTMAFALLLIAAGCAPKKAAPAPSLKESLDGKFLIGVAINEKQIRHQDPKADSLIYLHFNAIEPENCMKSEVIHPAKDTYDFELSDKYVDYGTKNGIAVFGHCLIWHSQLAPWFPVDETGKDVSPEELKARMKEHIYTVMGRYKGRIKGWDVVNEAVMDDGSYRESPFYRILGEEYIPLAFQYAHEADPDAELYYNDYGMHHRGRVDRVIQIVKDLKERGLRIDAVGFQGHIGMDYPDIATFEKSIEDVSALGVDICITEWDMSILPTITSSADLAEMSRMGKEGDKDAAKKAKALLDPYPDGIPQDVRDQWNNRCIDFWKMYLRHSDRIRRINIWGLTDADSWKRGWPVQTRLDEPVLFDTGYNEKPATKWIIENAKTFTK